MRIFPRLFFGTEKQFGRIFFKEILAAERNDSGMDVRHHMVGISSRAFFQFPGKSINSTKKEYSGKKLVGYSMNSMFDVVSDVSNYKNFIPFCKQSTVTSRTENHLKADLVIGFPPIVESYTSNVTLLRPNLVKAVCTDGKLFKHLLTTWKFSPGLKNSENTCIIDFYVSFEFRSPLHSQLAHLFFNELVRQMEGAFYQEAKARYGTPTIKTQFLGVPHVQTRMLRISWRDSVPNTEVLERMDTEAEFLLAVKKPETYILWTCVEERKGKGSR